MNIRKRATLCFSMFATLACSLATTAHGASGTWIQTTAGPFDWGTSGNWSGGTIADGADSTANFTANITAGQTVNLDSARTIGNITFTDSTTNSNDLTISGANILTLDRTDATKPTINVTQSARTLTINSVIAGNDGVQKSGAGTLAIDASNTFSGGIDLAAGTLRMLTATNDTTLLGVAGNTLTFTGDATLSTTADGTYDLPQGITINNSVTATLAGAFGESIVATGALTGSGTLRILGGSNGWAVTMNNTSNTFTGAINITANNTATLTVASLGTSANAITLGNAGNTGVFTYTGGAALSRPFTMGGTTGGSTINASGAGAITASSFSVTGSGSKTLTLGGSNSGANAISGNIVNNGGNTNVTKANDGSWALDGAGNTFSGTILFNGTSGSNGTLSYASAAGTNAITFNQTTGTATLSYTGAAPLTMSGLITASALTTGTITLNASGVTSADTINYSNASSLSTVSTSTGARNIVFGGSNTGANIFNGTITNNSGAGGTATVTKNGNGRWLLTGSNTYTGTTAINAGVLQAAVSGGGLPTSSILQLRGGVFQSSGTFSRTVGTAAGNVNWSTSSGGFAANGGTLNIQLNGGTGSVTWNGSSFVQTGQTLIFGSTTADSLVDFQNAINLGSSGTNNRTISVIDNPNSTADMARISGALTNTAAGQGLIKSGDGTLELTSVSNSYTGPTFITAGTLLVNGTHTGGGLYTVGDGVGTDILGGSGIINAAVNILASGGVLAPGTSPGLLTINGDVSIAGDLSSELAGVTVGTNYDQLRLQSTGTYNVTLGGTLTPLFSGSGWATPSTRLWIVNNESAGSLTGVFSNFPTNGQLVTTYDSQPWYIYYNADFASLSTTGGNDVLLTPFVVPEPSSLMMLAFGMISLWMFRRK